MLCTATGRPIGQRNAHRSWTRILEKAGVEHRGIHHLRHTFVTTLAEHGVHERVAQQLAGHADGRMTKELYTHVTHSMLDAAAHAIAEAVAAASEGTRGSQSGSHELTKHDDEASDDA